MNMLQIKLLKTKTTFILNAVKYTKIEESLKEANIPLSQRNKIRKAMALIYEVNEHSIESEKSYYTKQNRKPRNTENAAKR